jgi:hypothetical protein
MKAVVKSLPVKASEVIYFGLVPLHIYIPTLFDGFFLSLFASCTKVLRTEITSRPFRESILQCKCKTVK